MIPRAAFRVIALVAALSTASCSWIFMSAAPDPPVRTEPDCSTTRVPAVLDFTLGIPYLALGIAFMALASSWQDDEEQDALQIGAGSLIVFGGVFTWSGFSGIRMARECREAQAEFEEWVNNPQLRQPKRNPWETRPVRPGAEGGMCARGDTCDEGLACASGFCVRLAPAPAPTGPAPTPGQAPGTPVPPPPY